MSKKHKGMKGKIKALKERYVEATTDKERDVIREEMRILCDEDANTVAETSLEIDTLNYAIQDISHKLSTIHVP
jgi:hypothetical protein